MDWKATLEEILAERRQQLGERPSLEELVALRAGELPEDDRRRLLEHAAVDPEAARELFDVLRFPEAPPSEEDESEGEDLGLDQRWQALRQRLLEEGELPAEPARPSPGHHRWLALAATFLLGVAATWTIDRLREEENQGTPGLNLPIVELLPAASGAAGLRGAEVAELGTEAGGLLLALAVPDLAPAGGPYRLELSTGGDVAASFEGLDPGPGGVFVLAVPRGYWADGRHELRLTDSRGRAVARFELEVELRR